MIVYLPDSRVLNVAELATHTLHNLLPLRGAQVRDAKRWSQSLNDALQEFGGDAQVIIDQHQWPVWGNERVRAKLAKFRDLYKYVHDQTLRMMNQGMEPVEIAESLTAPPGLERDWSTRGYYGTLPECQGRLSEIHRLVRWQPRESQPAAAGWESKKYVEYMGGPDAVIARARRDFNAGNCRWVATVMSQVVFADASNTEARHLAADAFEQLGYLAEFAPWRNSYLLAAQELRTGVRGKPGPVTGISPQTLRVMPVADVFDYLATRVNGPRAGTQRLIIINWTFDDTGESLASTLQHGALTRVAGKLAPDAHAAVTTTRPVVEAVILGQRTLADALERREITASGDVKSVLGLWALLVDFQTAFPIVEPAGGE